MQEIDYLPYKYFKYASYNERLDKIIYFLARKRRNDFECTIKGHIWLYPKRRDTIKYICDKCNDFFGITISARQIRYLLRGKMDRFPYTAIIIIETIYNLIEEERNLNGEDKYADILMNLYKQYTVEVDYDRFLLGTLPDDIAGKTYEYMHSKYSEIFDCFISSRELYRNEFNGITFNDCMSRVPHEILGKEMIPMKITEYQNHRVYIK